MVYFDDKSRCAVGFGKLFIKVNLVGFCFGLFSQCDWGCWVFGCPLRAGPFAVSCVPKGCRVCL
jgi:hypothetical protein